MIESNQTFYRMISLEELKEYYDPADINKLYTHLFEEVEVKIIENGADLNEYDINSNGEKGFWILSNFYIESNRINLATISKNRNLSEGVSIDSTYRSLIDLFKIEKYENQSQNIISTQIGEMELINNPPRTKPEWNFYSIAFRVRTKINDVEKIGYSNRIVIFNSTPTVSYRKNCLGINTFDVDKFRNEIRDSENTTTTSDAGDAILVVGETLGRNMLYFIGAEEADDPMAMNIRTKRIYNFIIDGGTWD